MQQTALERMTSPFFVYRARREDVIDAQTVDMRVDCGFGIVHRARFELVGIDCHDVYGDVDEEEFEKGRAEAVFVARWLNDAASEVDFSWPFIISTLRCDEGEYGSYLAEIYRRDTGASLNDDLREEFPELAT